MRNFVLPFILGACGALAQAPIAPQGPQAPQAAKLFKAHCFCQIAPIQGQRPSSLSGVVQDLGILKEYSGINPDKDANQYDCTQVCSLAAFEWWKGVDKNAMCQRQGKNTIVAYAHVGAQQWQHSQTLAELNCCASGGGITCPANWTADANGPGNKKCKSLACMLHTDPPPPNNTLIGNWGFTWGNGIWQWGPATSIAPVTYKLCP